MYNEILLLKAIFKSPDFLHYTDLYKTKQNERILKEKGLIYISFKIPK